MITLPWPHPKTFPNAKRRLHWSPEEDAALKSMWEAGATRNEISSASGRSVGSIANRAYRLRLSTPREWSDDELSLLTERYSSAKTSEDLRLHELALALGRSYDSIIIKAGRIGLSDIKRKGVKVRADAPKYADDEARRLGMSEMAKKRIARDGHPRHMLGKSHSADARRTIAEKNRKWHAQQSAEQISDRVLRARKAAVANGSTNAGRSRGSWKAGWREIGGKRNFYRSRWEANYARYLQWLRERGQIMDWQHEPETFWFEAIKRGVRSYLPDFRVWENDGTSRLHEVKGWMDSRSKTTLQRMAKYHPNETIIVVREKQYKEIARKIGPMIPDWEVGEKPGCVIVEFPPLIEGVGA